MLTGIPPVTVDWTINIGGLIQIVILVSGLLAAYYGMKADIRVIRGDVDQVMKKQDRMTEALTKVAVQDNRLERLEQDVRELRHGEGFVFPLVKARPSE